MASLPFIANANCGALTEWTASRTLHDNNSLVVTAAAAKEGSHGFEFNIDDANTLRLGMQDIDSISDAYIHFWLRLRSGFTMANNDLFNHGVIGTGNVCRRNIKYTTTGGIRLFLDYWLDDATQCYIPANGGSGLTVLLPGLWYWIVERYKVSSGAGNDDGIVALWINDRLVGEDTNLDTDTLGWGHGAKTRFNLLAADLDVGTLGVMDIDYFTVTDSYISQGLVGRRGAIRTSKSLSTLTRSILNSVNIGQTKYVS